MSESCPNCGSAVNENSRYNVGEYQKYECGCMTSGFGDSRKACPTQACRLIRSLREELAGARDAERDRIAQYVLHLCYIDLAKAIRNNEHRSDT